MAWTGRLYRHPGQRYRAFIIRLEIPNSRFDRRYVRLRAGFFRLRPDLEHHPAGDGAARDARPRLFDRRPRLVGAAAHRVRDCRLGHRPGRRADRIPGGWFWDHRVDVDRSVATRHPESGLTVRIGVVTDSTCDLPAHLAEQHGIKVVPSI